MAQENGLRLISHEDHQTFFMLIQHIVKLTGEPFKYDESFFDQEKALAKCVVIVPENAVSPLGKHEEVSWLEVMWHVAKRLTNVNLSFKATVLTEKELQVDKQTCLLFCRSI